MAILQNFVPDLFIRKATCSDSSILMRLAKLTFTESHGHSAPKVDIAEYIKNNYTIEQIEKELEEANNHYYLLFIGHKAIGFSKICMNIPHNSVDSINIAKLERLYVLKDYHGLSYGYQLFNFNLELCIKCRQDGIWLNVWVENSKALEFYKKIGFRKIGEYSFKISSTHSNPNHQLYLNF